MMTHPQWLVRYYDSDDIAQMAVLQALECGTKIRNLDAWLHVARKNLLKNAIRDAIARIKGRSRRRCGTVTPWWAMPGRIDYPPPRVAWMEPADTSEEERPVARGPLHRYSREPDPAMLAELGEALTRLTDRQRRIVLGDEQIGNAAHRMVQRRARPLRRTRK